MELDLVPWRIQVMNKIKKYIGAMFALYVFKFLTYNHVFKTFLKQCLNSKQLLHAWQGKKEKKVSKGDDKIFI